jgi:hypothetical protein
VNLKQTFSFTANGTYKNKERETDGKKGKSKERVNISETFYSNSGVWNVAWYSEVYRERSDVGFFREKL